MSYIRVQRYDVGSQRTSGEDLHSVRLYPAAGEGDGNDCIYLDILYRGKVGEGWIFVKDEKFSGFCDARMEFFLVHHQILRHESPVFFSWKMNPNDAKRMSHWQLHTGGKEFDPA